MKYNLILESWKQFLQEADMTSVAPTSTTQTTVQSTTETQDEKQKQTVNRIKQELPKVEKAVRDLAALVSSLQEAKKKKKSGDRCTRIAKRKYDVWPSAYASGAVVKCRQGKIWKGISENATDEEIDQELLLEEISILEEEWSDKYKRSINCKNPKGFSQKAHCQGKKKKNEEIDLGEVEIIEEELDEAKKKGYKPNFSKEKEQGLHGWFARNKGKGWINCRTGGPCGRSSSDSGGKYPACRPTKAQCKSAGKGPLRKKTSSKPISWTKNKKKD